MSFRGPQPSPDGKRIYAVGEQSRSELVRYDTKSGQFLPYLEGAPIGDISFSRDGNWMVYVTYPDSILWRSRVDGTQKLQLTTAGQGGAFLPSWSPEGKQIIFSMGESTKRARLNLISADGGTPRVLTGTEFDAVCASWLPDGKSVVFLEMRGVPSTSVTKIINIETLQVTEVHDSTGVFDPVASPDGRYIAGPSINGRKLMLFDFTTQKWSDLLTMNVGWTSWSRDSKYIYFDTGLTENPAFYRVRVADRKLERIADLKGFRRVVFAWIPWSSITPDGAPLLLRDISSQEVYALDLETP